MITYLTEKLEWEEFGGYRPIAGGSTEEEELYAAPDLGLGGGGGSTGMYLTMTM